MTSPKGPGQDEGLASLSLSLSLSDQSNGLVGLQSLIALPELKQLTVALIAVSGAGGGEQIKGIHLSSARGSASSPGHQYVPSDPLSLWLI